MRPYASALRPGGAVEALTAPGLALRVGAAVCLGRVGHAATADALAEAMGDVLSRSAGCRTGSARSMTHVPRRVCLSALGMEISG